MKSIHSKIGSLVQREMRKQNAEDIKQNSLIESVSQHYEHLLGFQPRRTNLKILNKIEWSEFCEKFNLDNTSKGIFTPRNLTAYIPEHSAHPELSIFHEFFGHGLFCEYSKQGKMLQNLENRLRSEERIRLGRTFNREELTRFREDNSLFRRLKQLKEENLQVYEAFAIWTEHYLSQKFGLENKFYDKYNQFDGPVRRALEDFISMQKKVGELSLFYEIGFPKYPSKDRVAKLLEGILKGGLSEVELVVSYGSRKSYSDIDLMIISKNNYQFFNGWLDIKSLNYKQFEYQLSVFDIAVAQAVTKGEILIGDNELFLRKQKQLKEQTITKEAIYYNIIKSKEARNLASYFPKESKENKKAESYALTYMKNALNLSRRIRDFS